MSLRPSQALQHGAIHASPPQPPFITLPRGDFIKMGGFHPRESPSSQLGPQILSLSPRSSTTCWHCPRHPTAAIPRAPHLFHVHLNENPGSAAQSLPRGF